MRRALIAGAPLLALLFAPPVHAGIGSALLKAAKVAGKAGAKAGTAGKAAKGGAALKGAKLVTAGAAAERAFFHLPAQGERAALFLAHGDDGLRAVLRGSDEVIEGTGVHRLIDDLDAMAAAGPNAGVDLLVDVSALDHLAELPKTSRTRLWLARTDGPPLPLDELLAGDEVVKVAWARPNLALDVGSPAARATVDLSIRLLARQNPYEVTVPEDLACAQALRQTAQEAGFLVVDEHGEHGVILVDLGGDPELLPFADQHGLTAIQLHIADLCAVEPASGELAIAQVLGQLAAALTWAEVWSAAASEDVPARSEAHEPFGEGDVVRIGGRFPLTTFHPARPEPETPLVPVGSSAGAIVAGVIAGFLAVLGIVALRLGSRRNAK